MPRTIPIAIGAGILSALVFALVLTGSPLALVISPFTMLPLLLVGLSNTALVGGLAAGSGVLAIGLIGGSLSWAALYAAAEAIPALGLSRLALRKRTGPNGTARFTASGPLFTSAVIYMAALFLVLYVALMGREGGMLGEISTWIAAMMRESGILGGNEAVVQALAFIVPGAQGFWWLIILLANLTVAQALLTRWGRNLRPALELSRMALPSWLVALFGLAVILGLAADGDLGFIGWTLGMILVVPFFFVGMVCVHLLCRGWAPGPFILTGIYLVLILRGWPALIAAVLGIAEQWIKLRDRIGGPRPV